MIVAVANTKGGVGKTTLAVQLSLARALAGRDVWLIDGDRQGTAMAAIAARSEAEKQPGIACAQYADGPQIRAQVQQQLGKWDDIIIDVGGRDSTALRAALILADTLLVPFAPRSYDVWALDDMAELVDDARSVRDGLRAFAVMNQADPGPSQRTTLMPSPLLQRFLSLFICPHHFAVGRLSAMQGAQDYL
ncbi:Chromosome partitioning protein ParA (plasmid) [Sodalis glossinidius str. 'morsitans']|uniref:Chromosome partitioning protein ParA n=1 Tax=Sodalis glossinidius (strain morsitans) TaxID=343509 RepID=A0A193QP02_SODGM|nr:Chromosome partitioning protein ParA [Sodalis glossinidius str. 'morsitans']